MTNRFLPSRDVLAAFDRRELGIAKGRMLCSVEQLHNSTNLKFGQYHNTTKGIGRFGDKWCSVIWNKCSQGVTPKDKATLRDALTAINKMP